MQWFLQHHVADELQQAGVYHCIDIHGQLRVWLGELLSGYTPDSTLTLIRRTSSMLPQRY